MCMGAFFFSMPCASQTCNDHRAQRKPWDPLELELQKTVSCPVTGTSKRVARPLHVSGISLTEELRNYIFKYHAVTF